MAAPRRRRDRKPALMGSHQRCWLWGRHVVLETLRAGRWPVVELRIDETLGPEELQLVTDLAAERGLTIIRESAGRLKKLCGAGDHQGLLAKMRPFPYCTLDELLPPQGGASSLVMLDRIQDSFNFGAIIRAADVLGIDGLIVGSRAQADVNSQAARSSAGAVNYLPLAKVPDLVAAARRMRDQGFSVVVADATAERSIAQQDLTQPTTYILGNESRGVSEDLKSLSTASVRIPQLGQVESLNVAVAAGILFYELRRQRDEKGMLRGE